MSITRETRLEGYRYAHAAPQLSPRMALIISALRIGPMNAAEEIMAVLHTQNPNNVRPRLTALHQRGFIQAAGKKRGADGHSATMWEATVHGSPSDLCR